MHNPVCPIKYLYEELLIRDCFSPVPFSLKKWVSASEFSFLGVEGLLNNL
jgi:hypothetical protein